MYGMKASGTGIHPWAGAFFLRSAFVLLFALVVFLPACKGKPNDEDAVKAVMKEMADSAGKKDISGVMKHIARDYKDASGNDYGQIKGVLAMYFIQPEGISVFLRKQHIEVKGEKAAAVVNAVVSRGQATEASGFVFDLSFKKMDGEWMLTSALWRQVGIGQAL
jgi:hypothetical protein